MHVIFVCDTNQTLSPIAESVLHELATQRFLEVTAGSAAVSVSRAGQPADPLAVKVAGLHEIDISKHVARKIAAEDFTNADLVIAFDRALLRQLLTERPRGCRTEIRMFSSFLDSDGPSDVAPPSGDDIARYEKAYETIEIGVRGILNRVRAAKADANVSE